MERFERDWALSKRSVCKSDLQSLSSFPVVRKSIYSHLSNKISKHVVLLLQIKLSKSHLPSHFPLYGNPTLPTYRGILFWFTVRKGTARFICSCLVNLSKIQSYIFLFTFTCSSPHNFCLHLEQHQTPSSHQPNQAKPTPRSPRPAPQRLGRTVFNPMTNHRESLAPVKLISPTVAGGW